MKMGTAPVSITTLVCRKVPEAMLVSAQAASNCWEHTQDTHATLQLIHSLILESGNLKTWPSVPCKHLLQHRTYTFITLTGRIYCRWECLRSICSRYMVNTKCVLKTWMDSVSDKTLNVCLICLANHSFMHIGRVQCCVALTCSVQFSLLFRNSTKRVTTPGVEMTSSMGGLGSVQKNRSQLISYWM